MFSKLLAPTQGSALAVPGGPWCPTCQVVLLGNWKILAFSLKSNAGHPRFHRFRELTSLQFSLQQSFDQKLVCVKLCWRANLNQEISNVNKVIRNNYSFCYNFWLFFFNRLILSFLEGIFFMKTNLHEKPYTIHWLYSGNTAWVTNLAS